MPFPAVTQGVALGWRVCAPLVLRSVRCITRSKQGGCRSAVARKSATQFRGGGMFPANRGSTHAESARHPYSPDCGSRDAARTRSFTIAGLGAGACGTQRARPARPPWPLHAGRSQAHLSRDRQRLDQPRREVRSPGAFRHRGRDHSGRARAFAHERALAVAAQRLCAAARPAHGCGRQGRGLRPELSDIQRR